MEGRCLSAVTHLALLGVNYAGTGILGITVAIRGRRGFADADAAFAYPRETVNRDVSQRIKAARNRCFLKYNRKLRFPVILRNALRDAHSRVWKHVAGDRIRRGECARAHSILFQKNTKMQRG